jgi:hypothetical protein
MLTGPGYAGQLQAPNGASKGPMVSPNYREEAERIVAEEKAQGEKMPVYEVCLWHESHLTLTYLLGPRGIQVGREDG